MNFNKGIITVLSGFSGAGKGTIMKHLLDDHPGAYHLSISATTREMRTGEIEGQDYFFHTTEQFERMIADGDFLEYAKFNGNYYGTPKPYVERLAKEGKDVLLEIEVNGALQVKEIFPDALLLFVTPPNATTLKERLVGRGTETQSVIEERLNLAHQQSFLMDKYDYFIVNDDLEECVERVHQIIQNEKLRSARNLDNIARMQGELEIFAKNVTKD